MVHPNRFDYKGRSILFIINDNADAIATNSRSRTEFTKRLPASQHVRPVVINPTSCLDMIRLMN